MLPLVFSKIKEGVKSGAMMFLNIFGSFMFLQEIVTIDNSSYSQKIVENIEEDKNFMKTVA